MGGVLIKNKSLLAKDVNFYDYRGRLRYSYTTAEALALTELPSVPTVDHLIELLELTWYWNWTLQQMKTFIQVHKVCDIAMVCSNPVDNMKLIVLGSDSSVYIPVVFQNTTTTARSMTASVAWGDGNVVGASDSATRDEYKILSFRHNYRDGKKLHIIEISITSSYSTTYLGADASNTYFGVSGSRVSFASVSSEHRTTKCALSNLITKYDRVHKLPERCNGILAIPPSVTTVGVADELVHTIPSYKQVSLPPTITKMYNPGFASSISPVETAGEKMRRLILPTPLTEIIQDDYYWVLVSGSQTEKVYFPSSLTKITGALFKGTKPPVDLTDLYFHSANPPTVTENTFQEMPGNLQITIHCPAGKLSAYTSKAYWPSTSVCNYVDDL